MVERRKAERRDVDVYFNRFVDGYPYLCRGLELSKSGAWIETYTEPERASDRFPVELRLPGDDETLWLWARRIRREGTREAVEFVSLSGAAQRRIESFVEAA